MKVYKIAKYVPILLLSPVVSTVALADEGDRGGNGGYAAVCRDQQGAIVSAQPLDLMESAGAVPEDSQAPEAQMSIALERLRRVGEGVRADLIESEWFDLEKKIQFIPRGYALKETYDAEDVFARGSNCGNEQLAVYRADLDKLYLNPEIYHKLTPTGVAAMRLHEAIYKRVKRIDSKANSIQTRHLVRAILNPATPPTALRQAVQILGAVTDLSLSESLAHQWRKSPASKVRCQGTCTPNELVGSYTLLNQSGNSIAYACFPSISMKIEGRVLVARLGGQNNFGHNYNMDEVSKTFNLDYRFGLDGDLKTSGVRIPNRSGGVTASYHYGKMETGASHMRLWMRSEENYGYQFWPSFDEVDFIYVYDFVPTPEGNVQMIRYYRSRDTAFKVEQNCLYQRRAF